MASDVTIRFWGVRGSLPAPGPATVRYGGNTSCVSIDGVGPDGRAWALVLDAGTGIRELGKVLVGDPERDIHFFLSHSHWDHIQGFPFFAPLYQKGRRIYLSPQKGKKMLFRLLMEQMDGSRFPLTHEQLPADLRPMTDLEQLRRTEAGFTVERFRVNHPGDAYGFRLTMQGVRLVYIPDNELDPPAEVVLPYENLVDWCRDADVLVHDAQYTTADMPAKRGWGHSRVDRVLDLARDAEVRHLILFHHDPDRTDDEIDRIQAEARAGLKEAGSTVACTAAFEGLTLTYTPAPSNAPSGARVVSQALR